MNQTLSNELSAEAPGILVWAVQGCREWQQSGLGAPDSVTQATREYERDSDVLAAFLAEACELVPDAEVGAADLFAHYRQWAEIHGMNERERLNSTAFGRKVSERFRNQHTRAGKVYFGVARKPL